jgi:hypothetical protein
MSGGSRRNGSVARARIRAWRYSSSSAVRPAPGPAFDVPTLDVETTSGYDPPLEQIVAFAR